MYFPSLSHFSPYYTFVLTELTNYFLYFVLYVTSVIKVCRDIGLRGCYRGLAPRALMVGILTALQFTLYENTKDKVGEF